MILWRFGAQSEIAFMCIFDISVYIYNGSRTIAAVIIESLNSNYFNVLIILD